MPSLVISTNLSKDQIPEKFCAEATSFVAEQLGKPASYVVVQVCHGQVMTFGGTDEPCANINLTCIGVVGPDKNRQLAPKLSQFIEQKLGIKQDRPIEDDDSADERTETEDKGDIKVPHPLSESEDLPQALDLPSSETGAGGEQEGSGEPGSEYAIAADDDDSAADNFFPVQFLAEEICPHSEWEDIAQPEAPLQCDCKDLNGGKPYHLQFDEEGLLKVRLQYLEMTRQELDICSTSTFMILPEAHVCGMVKLLDRHAWSE